MRRTIAVSLLALSLTSPSIAADWPQHTGPDRNNVSSETGLIKSFPAEGPNVLWTIKTGPGFGAPAIRDNQVFFLDRIGDKNAEQDVLRCLDIVSGKELWSYTYDAPGYNDFPGSRTAPAVTESRIFSVGAKGHFLCVDRNTHAVLWQTNTILPDGKPGNWAISVAPLLYRNSIIVNIQSAAAGLAAYDQATGNVLWQAKEVPSVPYCSPTLITIGGKQQVVLCVNNGVYAVDPDTGALLWKFNNWKCGIPIPNVTQMGDGRLFITGGYRAGSVMIQVTPSAAGFDVKELWRIPLGSQIHQPILVDGALYFNGVTNETMREGLDCLDPADGKVLWSTKATFPPERGTVLFADGLLYHIDASGTLRTFQPNREAYTEVSSAKLLGGRDIWAPIALSNGYMVIRDQSQMKCLALQAK